MEQVKKKAAKRMEATELPAVPLNSNAFYLQVAEYAKDCWSHATPVVAGASKILAWLPVFLSPNLLAVLVG
eukprot:2013938-Karenia_brevis.AAC.1